MSAISELFLSVITASDDESNAVSILWLEPSPRIDSPAHSSVRPVQAQNIL